MTEVLAAAAAAFLTHAAELTPDPAQRGRRAVAAAQAKFDAAAADAALELLATAELAPHGALQRARLERLRAEIAFERTRGSGAPRLLLDAAQRLELVPFGRGPTLARASARQARRRPRAFRRDTLPKARRHGAARALARP